PLPGIKPEKVGVSAQRLERISDLARRYVEDGKFAGIVTMVSRHGKVIHYDAHGQFGLDNDTPMAADTLFRIYSMTKAVTSVAAMILYEEGKFQMTDPVAKYLPEFRDQKLQNGDELVDPASPMTMRQLFTHTAGLSYGWTPDNPVDLKYVDAKLNQSRDSDEFIAKLAELPLRFEPGTRYHYSYATDVLGIVVERLSGQSLDVFFEERIFKPLGMVDTFFSVPPEKVQRLASVHYWDSETNAIKLVPAENQRNFQEVTFFSGGGGLVSTIGDYMRFCEMLRNGGKFNGARLLGPKTVQFMSSDQLTPEVRAVGRGEYPSLDFFPGQSMAMGLGVITNPGITPAISSKGELSWGGIAGTQFWIDPEEEIIGIAMVQLFRSPWPLRFDFKVATYQALTELNSK
ncbi:MAG: beta-lactamase family protein, partial [Gammaproteobacteria bacterium]|nr:beta-lactamase family protein [Gammaproteobacteria bacterium]NNL51590.1 beta-lactamase family protein [Woeseiaceae bacterium]